MITIKVNLGAANFAERIANLAQDALQRVNLAVAKELKLIVVDMFDEENAAKRAKPWPNKADGQPSNLTKTTTLRRSFFTDATPEFGSVSTQTEYAAKHQFGGDFDVPEHDRTIRQAWGRPIDPPKTIRVRAYKMTVPARPFFPFDDQGNLTPSAEQILVETAEAGIERELSRRQ